MGGGKFFKEEEKQRSDVRYSKSRQGRSAPSPDWATERK